MKILLFTHKSDIDGMGSAILSKLSFKDVEYVLCETFNVQTEVEKYYNNGKIYNYDKVYITDLWLEEPMLSIIAKDTKLKNKFYIFDHHKTSIEKNINNYPFVTLKISDENGLCCGTSLFYEHLIQLNLIDNSNLAIKEFSELTRKHDTWEWKTKYNDDKPRKLALLFDSIGCNNYINLIYKKLSNSTNFVFNEFETMLINNKISQVNEKVVTYSNKLFYKEILGLKAGIAFIDYEYRNELAEYLKEQNFDIDFIMMIALDYGTVSYRSIKDNVNVRKIGEAFGGKGHDKAASNPISDNQKQTIIELLTALNK